MNNIKEMTIEEITKALGYEVKIVKEHSGVQLANVEQYKTFKIGETEFIVLEQVNGATICLTRNFIAENTQFDEETYNLANASILKVLDEFEEKIANEIGAANMLPLEIDLTTGDGLKDYGSIKRKTGLLTDVQYRQHSEGIEQYAVNDWWWLANAVSTPRRNIQYSVRCVAACGGFMDSLGCINNYGVRAVCVLRSNISVTVKN